MKEIQQIKADAQKKHDEINRETKALTDSAIAKAQKGVMGLELQVKKKEVEEEQQKLEKLDTKETEEPVEPAPAAAPKKASLAGGKKH